MFSQFPRTRVVRNVKILPYKCLEYLSRDVPRDTLIERYVETVSKRGSETGAQKTKYIEINWLTNKRIELSTETERRNKYRGWWNLIHSESSFLDVVETNERGWGKWRGGG